MNPSNPFLAWIVAALLWLCPIDERVAWQASLGDKLPSSRRESADAMRARYLSIASAIDQVVSDPEVPPVFPGPNGRRLGAEVLLSILKTESDLRVDVDTGEGPSGRGDHGRSWCLAQIQTGKVGHVPAGPPEVKAWTGKDLVGDHVKCVRAAYEMVRVSVGACRHLPWLDRLSAYTTGRCQANEPASRRKLNLAYRLRLFKRPTAPSTSPDPLPESAAVGPAPASHAAP